MTDVARSLQDVTPRMTHKNMSMMQVAAERIGREAKGRDGAIRGKRETLTHRTVFSFDGFSLYPSYRAWTLVQVSDFLNIPSAGSPACLDKT
jgi:hypothetical protein